MTKPQADTLSAINFHVNLDLRKPNSSFKSYEPILDKEKVPGIIPFKADFAFNILGCCLQYSAISIHQTGRGGYKVEYYQDSGLPRRDCCLL